MLAKKLNYTAKRKAAVKYDLLLNTSISEILDQASKAAEEGKFSMRHELCFIEHFQLLKEDLEKAFKQEGFEVYVNSSVRSPHTDNTRYIYDITLRWEKSYDDHTP